MIPKHALEIIEAIKQTEKKLSKWESGFLATVSIQAKQDRRLSDKQAKSLQDVYANVTGGGLYEDRQRI